MPQLHVAPGDSPQELVFVFHQEGFRNQTWSSERQEAPLLRPSWKPCKLNLKGYT